MLKNIKRYYLLQNTIEDSERKGYIIKESIEPECMIKLISLTGKREQAPRIYKLYKLFSAINNKSCSVEEKNGNIESIILAN
jgi:hypothetical protein